MTMDLAKQYILLVVNIYKIKKNKNKYIHSIFDIFPVTVIRNLIPI